MHMPDRLAKRKNRSQEKKCKKMSGGFIISLHEGTDSFLAQQIVASAAVFPLIRNTFLFAEHEATSRFFEKGLNIMEVASITGHKTLAMLKRYTHLRAEDLAAKLG